MACDLTPPPEPYNHGPTPQYQVLYLSDEEMDKLTNGFKNPFGVKLRFCGYTDINSEPMIIYIRDSVKSEQLLEHEIGHVRGWRHKIPENLKNLLTVSKKGNK